MPGPFAFLLHPLLAVAGVGFVASVVVHVAALVGIAPPAGKLVWALHAGIFVVWLPVVLMMQRAGRVAPQKDLWKTVLEGCPPWMRGVLYAAFAYALLNFVLFFLATWGHRTYSGDAPPAVIRGFSGHWMAFYGSAFGVIYSAIHAPHLFRPRRCSKGHESGPSAVFCPKCGEALEGRARIL